MKGFNMKKEDIVFALYVTVAVATTAHAGVEIWKTFRRDKAPKKDVITELMEDAQKN